MKPPKLKSSLQAWRGFGISFGSFVFLINLINGYLGGPIWATADLPFAGGWLLIKSSH